MMAATVVNLQRKVQLDGPSYRPFLKTLLGSVDEANGKHIAVAFISDLRMQELNSFFRGRDSTTDVLSFRHEPDEFDKDTDNLGDVVISVEQAERQAKEYGLTLENEIRQLILHGLLHLCGYDHDTDNGEMNARELELRDKLGI
jgi:probable rRNA maturation factor